MQQLAIIKQIFPIVDRQYTNQQGQPAVFTSQGRGHDGERASGVGCPKVADAAGRRPL